MTLTPRRLPATAICAVAGLLFLSACGATDASTIHANTTVSAKEIVKVEISSNQAVVNGGDQVTLTSHHALATFTHALTSDHISVLAHPTRSNGCSGGTDYTFQITRTSPRQATTLNIYTCGGTVTGNVSGHVMTFLSEVNTLLKRRAVP